MCGIAGGCWTDAGRPLERETLQEMTALLRHRGPDDEGHYFAAPQSHGNLFVTPGIALGSRRLAIIDRAGGHQPISNEDGSVWVVLNGQIYNFVELRRRLEGGGHRFRTQSDTETIVHLYEDEGVRCFEHLNGMFAIAIWDARQRQLVLARDRLGEKPLVYREEPGRLLFASELKSLLAVPGVPREIDPQALDEYLTYQYVPHPRTIFKGIAKLPPGCFAVYRDGHLTLDRYWSVDWNFQRELPVEEYRERLRETMTSAVELRLQSEVPLGAFLSGGIDSSIIVGLMQKLGSQPVQTFSIGFAEKEYDETGYAWQVARHLGTEHRQFRVEPQAVDILPRLVWHFDEPFADSSAIPTWYVAQFTKQHVTVALSGDGGDELFAGYRRYRAVRLGDWFDRMPEPLRKVATARFWQRLPASAKQGSWRRRFKKLVAKLSEDPRRRYFGWVSIFDEAARADLYTDEFVGELPDSDPFGFLRRAYALADQRDIVTATTFVDVNTYLPCDILTKVDVASMAHGLECRAPFLDFRVAELAIGMPLALKIRGMQGKRILRDTFAELMPPAVRRRGKMGFGVPLDHWFRGQLRELTRDVLLGSRARERGLFRPATVERLVDEHQQGRFDHSYRLWSLLVLEMWFREWVDGHPPHEMSAGAAATIGAT